MPIQTFWELVLNGGIIEHIAMYADVTKLILDLHEIVMNFSIAVFILVPFVRVMPQSLLLALYAGSIATLYDLDHGPITILYHLGIKLEGVPLVRPHTHSYGFVVVSCVTLYFALKILNEIGITRKWFGKGDGAFAAVLFVSGISLTSHILTDSLGGNSEFFWPIKISTEPLSFALYMVLLLFLTTISANFAKYCFNKSSS